MNYLDQREHGMLSSVKDTIRKHPRIFDLLRTAKRSLMPVGSDPTYDFLKDFSRRHSAGVTFVQIGANDGLRNDPIREFIVQDGWSGVLIEPLPSIFDLLKKNYEHLRNQNLVFVNAAISAADGASQVFYSFKEEFLSGLALEKRLHYLRKASFQREHVLKTIGEGNSAFIQEINVPSMSMASVLKKYWDSKPVDLLVIDAEGHEPAIIGAIDFDAFSPEAIFFESHNLGESKARLFTSLRDAGYHLTDLGPDTAAVRVHQRPR